MGKSFEIRPTGVAHADLLLPQEIAPNYPKSTVKSEEGKVVEHYSWKKVTTNISGFIIGSPTIDHYGDMVVSTLRSSQTYMALIRFSGQESSYWRPVHLDLQAPRLER
jgi:oxysterol-binding protein 1